jgi:cytochrome c oxidase cbb3-type subunit III
MTRFLSRPLSRHAPLRARAIATALVIGLAAACEREQRSFQSVPPGATAETSVRTSALHAGPGVPEPIVTGAYQENAWAIGEGQRLYEWMNCAGCHAPGGGGGIGPALTDDDWVYGSDPENVFDTIVEGRPHGMPSFRGRLGNDDVWKLVAYVRTLGGLTRKDAWSPRSENMAEITPQDDARGGGADTSRIFPEQLPPQSRPPEPRP